jgi:hypothetical protein
MAHMDVFNSDAFRMGSLTAALNKQDFQPTMIRNMGLFSAAPIRTSFATVEERDGALALVPTSRRGEPINEQRDTASEKRQLHRIDVPRLIKGDRLTADEIQDIRAFGSESELMQVQEEVARRMNGPNGLMRDIELTWENMALGAVQGTVVDADGSTVVVDWFNVFGVSQDAEINFNFSSNTDEGTMKPFANQVLRQMQRGGKGAFTPQTEVIALCGDNFYDKLSSHPDVTETYKHTNGTLSEQLRNEIGIAFDAFRWGNITWINYRGTDDNSTVAIGTEKAKFFPRGAQGVFQTAFAPSEDFEYVNTPGQPVYARTIPDQKRNQYVDIEVASYPLFMCTRPQMLQRAKTGA